MANDDDVPLHELLDPVELAEALAAAEIDRVRTVDARLDEIRDGIKRAVRENDPATACALVMEECGMLLASIEAHVLARLPSKIGADWKAHAQLDQLRSALREAASRLS